MCIHVKYLIELTVNPLKAKVTEFSVSSDVKSLTLAMFVVYIENRLMIYIYIYIYIFIYIFI